MNSCILMAKIVGAPELRYTQDNQLPVAQMLVEFEGTRPEDPPATLKVVGWGNLATEIQQKYAEGDRVIIEGRLAMNTLDRPEGFKEKRAELVASRIYVLDGPLMPSVSSSGPSSQAIATSTPGDGYKPKQPVIHQPEPDVPSRSPVLETAGEPILTASPEVEQNLDEIPF